MNNFRLNPLLAGLLIMSEGFVPTKDSEPDGSYRRSYKGSKGKTAKYAFASIGKRREVIHRRKKAQRINRKKG